jgi:hypothetical protein
MCPDSTSVWARGMAPMTRVLGPGYGAHDPGPRIGGTAEPVQQWHRTGHLAAEDQQRRLVDAKRVLCVPARQFPPCVRVHGQRIVDPKRRERQALRAQHGGKEVFLVVGGGIGRVPECGVCLTETAEFVQRLAEHHPRSGAGVEADQRCRQAGDGLEIRRVTGQPGRVAEQAGMGRPGGIQQPHGPPPAVFAPPHAHGAQPVRLRHQHLAPSQQRRAGADGVRVQGVRDDCRGAPLVGVQFDQAGTLQPGQCRTVQAEGGERTAQGHRLQNGPVSVGHGGEAALDDLGQHRRARRRAQQAPDSAVADQGAGIERAVQEFPQEQQHAAAGPVQLKAGARIDQPAEHQPQQAAHLRERQFRQVHALAPVAPADAGDDLGQHGP